MTGPDIELIEEEPVEEEVSTPLDMIREHVNRFLKARDLEKQAKKAREEARDVVANFLMEMGAEFGTIKGIPVVRWRETTKKVFNIKRFREDHPEFDDEYLEETVVYSMEVVKND
jgi:hypothetical protein